MLASVKFMKRLHIVSYKIGFSFKEFQEILKFIKMIIFIIYKTYIY